MAQCAKSLYISMILSFSSFFGKKGLAFDSWLANKRTSRLYLCVQIRIFDFVYDNMVRYGKFAWYSTSKFSIFSFVGMRRFRLTYTFSVYLCCMLSLRIDSKLKCFVSGSHICKYCCGLKFLRCALFCVFAFRLFSCGVNIVCSERRKHVRSSGFFLAFRFHWR